MGEKVSRELALALTIGTSQMLMKDHRFPLPENDSLLGSKNFQAPRE